MLLKIDRINTFYGDLQALFDVSAEINDGEIVSIIGSNGAGKSTTLNTISGILRSVSGTIHFKNQTITNASTHSIVESGIVQIPEARRLFPYMSVNENLELGSFSSRGRKYKDEMLKKVFKLFPILENRMSQNAGTMSGGEQQMLAIARGLMAMPRLLMLDEPSLGLAPIMVKQIFEVIQEINRDGIAILLVEQNVTHSLSIANRAYVLENGKIVMEGCGEELLKNGDIKKAYLGV